MSDNSHSSYKADAFTDKAPLHSVLDGDKVRVMI